jgi:hypothetical protein
VTTCQSCEEKFGAGCLNCTESDKCTKCDTLKGWIHTTENKCACNWGKDLVYIGGKCACKGNMYLNPQDGKCTAPDCGIGCVDCISKGVCKKCHGPDGWRVNDHEKCECSKFRWMLPSADGKECICKPKTWREDIRGWKICRACMHGCLDCTSLGDCTKCDGKGRWVLDTTGRGTCSCDREQRLRQHFAICYCAEGFWTDRDSTSRDFCVPCGWTCQWCDHSGDDVNCTKCEREESWNFRE